MLERHVRFGCTLGLIAALFALASPEAAPGLAVTAVVGTTGRGQTLTLTGAGFGTKPTGPPLKFDAFEGGPDNGNIGNGWVTSSNIPQYSSVVRRAGSAMSVRARFTNGAYGSSFGVSGVALPQVYLDAWYYLDAAAPYSRNHKLFRLHANVDGSPNLYYNLYCAGIDASNFSQDGVGGKFNSWVGLTAGSFGRKWAHVQVYLNSSSAGSNNGTAEMWVDGVKVVDERGTFRTREANQSLWDTLWLGNYMSHEADGSCPSAYGDAYTYWDDVYVDTSRARVEIGDSSSYQNSRHREVQPVQSWTNSSISFTYNPGTFTSTNGVYVFVTDDAGNVSPGYPLGTTTSGPTAPRNLRIVPGL